MGSTAAGTPGHRARSAVLLLALSLGGCSSHRAPDAGGAWTPVNRYADEPRAVALAADYAYRVTPLDGTLRGVLARWAADTGATLDYRHTHDFTLHAAASRVQASTATAAAAQLDALFAPLGVHVVVEAGNRFVVAGRTGAADAVFPAPMTAVDEDAVDGRR
jgi:hypothetical protein